MSGRRLYLPCMLLNNNIIAVRQGRLTLLIGRFKMNTEAKRLKTKD